MPSGNCAPVILHLPILLDCNFSSSLAGKFAEEYRGITAKFGDAKNLSALRSIQNELAFLSHKEDITEFQLKALLWLDSLVEMKILQEYPEEAFVPSSSIVSSVDVETTLSATASATLTSQVATEPTLGTFEITFTAPAKFTSVTVSSAEDTTIDLARESSASVKNASILLYCSAAISTLLVVMIVGFGFWLRRRKTGKVEVVPSSVEELEVEEAETLL